MGLNIKNPRTHELATELARLAGETKTEAITKALEERLANPTLQNLRKGRVPPVRRPCLGLAEAALAQEIGAVVVGAGDDLGAPAGCRR